METIHPSAASLPLERQRGFGKSRKHIDQCDQYGSGHRKIPSSRNNCYNQQQGGGKPLESDEEDETNDDETGSDGESDSENDISDVDADDDDEQDENWVFDRILDAVESNDDDNIKQRQKIFREKYGNFLIWLHHLKRNPTHKKDNGDCKRLT